MKKRVLQYMESTVCPLCNGKRLRTESLSVTFAGHDIHDFSCLTLKRLAQTLQPFADGSAVASADSTVAHPEKVIVAQRIAQDIVERLQIMLDLGLSYLSLERSTPTLSPGELQRLRLATQIRSNLFGVVYVLDEPSAGLHPVDTEALLRALGLLKAAGNSLFVVEHAVDVIRQADWIVDVGPAAGEDGGHVLYSGPPAGLQQITASRTREYLFGDQSLPVREPRRAQGWLVLRDVSRNNIHALDVEFPIGVFTSVTGISGSGKSTLVSQVLVEMVEKQLGIALPDDEMEMEALEQAAPLTLGGNIAAGLEHIRRLVRVDQKPIGRTPRSNLATYTGLFDYIRKLYAETPLARSRRYDAGRFSFNVAKGRCKNCNGEGFVMVELLFLPSVYAPCPVCDGSRYNPQTLEVKFKHKSIAEVLALTVNAACEFFAEQPQVLRPLTILRDIGLGYLRLGQPATELSGGEAQRIKLATEIQRGQRGATLYVLDEPTTGLHPSDVDRLMLQLNQLVDAGNTVIVVEHNMRVVAGGDWIIDIGPGAGEDGGLVVAAGTPADVAKVVASRTAPYLREYLRVG